MKHLLSYSVFQELTDISADVSGIPSFLKNIRCDGLELFTLFDKVPEIYYPYSVSVHLPYAIDWYRSWCGGTMDDGYEEGSLDYITFGRNPGEMVSNIRRGIGFATPVHPAYGVIHAGNTDLDQVMHRKHVCDDRAILGSFAEMMNEVVSGYKGGEPPFRLVFENLWWSGLSLTEPWECRMLEDKLEFEDWGLCLDTGHLMNTVPDAYDQSSAIEGAMRIIDHYTDDMRDRITNMHLHYSASAEYRGTFEESDRPDGESFERTLERSFSHVSSIDTHTPFSDPACADLVNAIRPDYVTHEMLSSEGRDPVHDFIQQRAFFD